MFRAKTTMALAAAALTLLGGPVAVQAAPDDYDAVRGLIDRSSDLRFQEKADLLEALRLAERESVDPIDLGLMVERGIHPARGMDAHELAKMIRHIAAVQQAGVPVKVLLNKALEALAKPPQLVPRRRILPRIEELAADLTWAVALAGTPPIPAETSQEARVIFHENVTESVWRHRLFFEKHLPDANWRGQTKGNLLAVFTAATDQDLWQRDGATTVGFAALVLADLTELGSEDRYFDPERARRLVVAAIPYGYVELEALLLLRDLRPGKNDAQRFYDAVDELLQGGKRPTQVLHELRHYTVPRADAPVQRLAPTTEVVPQTPMPGPGEGAMPPAGVEPIDPGRPDVPGAEPIPAEPKSPPAPPMGDG